MSGPDTARLALAEAIGTFGLVFGGTGAIVIYTVAGLQVTPLVFGIAFGLSGMIMIYAVGHISGAHINPAVTIAFAATRNLPLRLVPVYIVSQLAGAIAASAVFRALFGTPAHLGATLPRGSSLESLSMEVVLTFILMFVIMAVATDVRAVGQAAAIAIGATIGLENVFAAPISGASMNPARSLGPAIISNTWHGQWIDVVGPIVGALVAALAYVYLRGPQGTGAGATTPSQSVAAEARAAAHGEPHSNRPNRSNRRRR
ncbi:MAG TPA: MIP family channel protein [Thermomicrobiaceae bacterium]|nr:MIP family channel protein [Thermomicrobiaceae bacterium]